VSKDFRFLLGIQRGGIAVGTIVDGFSLASFSKAFLMGFLKKEKSREKDIKRVMRS